MGSKGDISDSSVDLTPSSGEYNSTLDSSNEPVWLPTFEGMEGLDESLASFQTLQSTGYPAGAGGAENGFGVAFQGASAVDDQPPQGGILMDLSMWVAMHNQANNVAVLEEPGVPAMMAASSKDNIDHVNQSTSQGLPARGVPESGPGSIHPKQSKSLSHRQAAARARHNSGRVVGRIPQKRPSISKGQINDNDHDQAENSEAVEDNGEERRERYREKNRLAAAKCRTKKKANVNGLEERHRLMAAENNIRKREERELRDQLTTLRTMALEHGPGRCNCGGLHNYNQAKAAEMALGHRIGGPMRTPRSPSSDSTSPVVSPLPNSLLGGSNRRLSSAAIPDPSHLLSQAVPQILESAVRPAAAASSPFGAHVSSALSAEDQASEILGRQVEEFSAFNDFLQSPPEGHGNL